VNRRDLASLFLIAFPFLFFFPVTFGTSAWYTRDISRVYHPFAVELARALSEGRLPLWTRYLQAGFPLAAEGQVAAFYLPQLLLVKFLPAHIAISYEMLAHLAFAAVGMYCCARTFGSGSASALVAGFAFSFNGFMIQKLYHTPILLTAAWLPWLIFLFERWQRARKDRDRRAGIWLILTALAVAMQWLAGSAQIAFLNSIILGLFGFVGQLFWNRAEANRSIRTIIGAALIPVVPLFFGTALAAMQLLPTAELLGYSTRAGGLDEKLLTLYSYSGDSLAQYVLPFSQGEPSDDNVELWSYCGLSILLLSLSALRLRRDARTIFWFVLAIAALSLTLGAVNPLFQLLSRLPIFSLFRVPARYAFPFAFAVIILAASGFDDLAKRLPSSDRLYPWLVGIFVCFGFLELALVRFAYVEPLEFWLSAWNILPWIIGSLALILIFLGYAKRIDRKFFQATMMGLVIFDLSAYAATFLSTTVAQLTPLANINQVPRSVSVLEASGPPERVLTDETIWPSVPALRASLYPNFGMLYEREMAHAYTPLWFDANENYFFNLTPEMLNLLNVRYFFVPLEPRFTDRRPMPYASLALDVVENEVMLQPVSASSIQIDSFTEDASTLPKGTPVAELVVRLDDDSISVFPFRSGIETADWDAASKSSDLNAAHSARTVVGFIRSLGHTFDANVYRAQFDLSPARRITSINVRALIPPARITVERIVLADEKGKVSSLAALTGKDDFLLRYMSDTVAIWENMDVLPRAFVVHDAKEKSGDQILEYLRKPDFRPDQVVLLSDGSSTDMASAPGSNDQVQMTQYDSQRVSVTVETDHAGYLVLADTFYPGWNAYVDGQATPIERADMIFRAIPIQAGRHLVTFEYSPMSLWIGVAISAVSLIVLLGIALVPRARMG
jgi:membrane protein YfhO